MIDYKEFKDLILIPALQSIDLYSDNAVAILCATMAQESSMGQYVEQKTNAGYGPARGPFEMEGATYNDIVDNYLTRRRPDLKELIIKVCDFEAFPGVDEMVSNLKFACIMARVFYLRCPGVLPDANDIEGQWQYYKTFWNSKLGSATHEEFMANHKRYIGV